MNSKPVVCPQSAWVEPGVALHGVFVAVSVLEVFPLFPLNQVRDRKDFRFRSWCTVGMFRIGGA